MLGMMKSIGCIRFIIMRHQIREPMPIQNNGQRHPNPPRPTLGGPSPKSIVSRPLPINIVF